MALWLVLAALLAGLAPPALAADAHDLCRQQLVAVDGVTPALPDAPATGKLPLCSDCDGCTLCSHGVALAGAAPRVRAATCAAVGPVLPEARPNLRPWGAAPRSARAPPAPAGSPARRC